MKISAGSSDIGMPLCLYDENGDPIALMNRKRPDKEAIALHIVHLVNIAHKDERERLVGPLSAMLYDWQDTGESPESAARRMLDAIFSEE